MGECTLAGAGKDYDCERWVGRGRARETDSDCIQLPLWGPKDISMNCLHGAQWHKSCQGWPDPRAPVSPLHLFCLESFRSTTRGWRLVLLRSPGGAQWKGARTETKEGDSTSPLHYSKTDADKPTYPNHCGYNFGNNEQA